MFGPLYEAFGASASEVGMFLSIFYMAMIVCRPLGSLTMERIGDHFRGRHGFDSIHTLFAALLPCGIGYQRQRLYCRDNRLPIYGVG